jgi:hypothetical protein
MISVIMMIEAGFIFQGYFFSPQFLVFHKILYRLLELKLGHLGMRSFGESSETLAAFIFSESAEALTHQLY